MPLQRITETLDRMKTFQPAVMKKALLSTFAFAALSVVSTGSAHAFDDFAKPTAEELSMTSLPGYPGASAVVLFREEITKDDLHVMLHYDRIKVLTEDGKKYANVELGFFSSSGGYDNYGDDKSIGDIVGRTIHPDGTIIPFTGKPYLKTIEKTKDVKYQQRIFTLPDVTVGSIIEYRYATRINDNIYEAPEWIIQSDLFIRSAHYMWYPTAREMMDEDGSIVNSISWFPILPENAKINRTETPSASSMSGPKQTYELTMKDVPPKKHEEYMPPIGGYSYRVMFAYTPYRTGADFWKSRGKQWSKRQDSFIGPNSALRNATQTITAGANTQDEKLRKIYAAVMEMENTSYTREHERREDKAAGLGKVNNAGDVQDRKRGTPTELTEVFVGMARAAGMKAYMMLVPDRSEEIFTPSWLSFRQFDDEVAIVNVDGKDRFFDPGQRYCPYGQLAWWHTWVGGLRQTEGGTDFAKTDGPNYTDNLTSRVANLIMDEHGEVHGRVDLTFAGSGAMRWRQAALKGDKESLDHSLTEALQKMVPGSLDVKVADIKGLTDYDKPLTVAYDAKGTLGAPTGKRLVMPVDLFLAGSSATFPHDKRELAVYFHYPEMVQDALRVNFPKNISIEAVPEASKLDYDKVGIYHMTPTTAPTNVTVRRTFAFNEVLIPPDHYAGLRTFYSQFEAKDQDSIVLKMAPQEAANASEPAAK